MNTPSLPTDVPTTAEGLALRMYSFHDPHLEASLGLKVGKVRARELMLRARSLLERWCRTTRTVGDYATDVVWTDPGGVDHEPIGELGATFCAVVLPDGYVTNPRQGQPCPTCFGPT